VTGALGRLEDGSEDIMSGDKTLDPIGFQDLMIIEKIPA